MLGTKNDLTESQLPTLDAFKIVPYPALDSQLLQIIFSPKTLLDKITKDVNDASILRKSAIEIPKKIASDEIQVPSILGIKPEDDNLVETPKIVTEELSVGKQSETPTEYDDIIKIVDAEPTIIDVVENIEIPKTILIEEVQINPTHNDYAHINKETKLPSDLNEAVSNLSSQIEDEISASDLQSPKEVTSNEDDLESTVIEGNPSNLLINESSEIMKKVAEMPDAIVSIDDCDECHDCDNTASEDGDLEMASNEVAPIQSENVAALDPIFEVETVAEVVPALRRARGPQAVPAVVVAEPNVMQKQDATKIYEELIRESADKKQVDLDIDENIEKLVVQQTASGLGEKTDQELSIAKKSIISSAEEKEIEQELDEMSIEDAELPKITSAEEKAIEKTVDETLAPKIVSEPAAFSIVEPILLSKNVKRQIGDDMRAYEIVRPATVNKPIFMNNLENETSSEKRERIQKGLQRLMHFVTIVGHVDSYLTKRFRNGVRTFARLCESGEDMRLRHRRSRFSF